LNKSFHKINEFFSLTSSWEIFLVPVRLRICRRSVAFKKFPRSLVGGQLIHVAWTRSDRDKHGQRVASNELKCWQRRPNRSTAERVLALEERVKERVTPTALCTDSPRPPDHCLTASRPGTFTLSSYLAPPRLICSPDSTRL
jgi:hypothetical protein